MKVVLDTNVLISGLAYPNSIPGKIVAAWDRHALTLAMSHFQLNEIARVLSYPKIRKLLGWSDLRIEGFIHQLMLRVEVIDISQVSATVPADPKDTPILATLIAAGADVLITGDSDLLAFQGQYPIETPAQLARRL